MTPPLDRNDLLRQCRDRLLAAGLPAEDPLLADVAERLAETEALEANSEDEFTLRDDHTCWISVDNLSVFVHRSDEGVVVDIYPKGDEDGDSVASTYAFFAEGPDQN